MAVRGASVVPRDHNARVERDHARFVGEQWIDVDLRNRGMVGD